MPNVVPRSMSQFAGVGLPSINRQARLSVQTRFRQRRCYAERRHRRCLGSSAEMPSHSRARQERKTGTRHLRREGWRPSHRTPRPRPHPGILADSGMCTCAMRAASCSRCLRPEPTGILALMRSQYRKRQPAKAANMAGSRGRRSSSSCHQAAESWFLVGSSLIVRVVVYEAEVPTTRVGEGGSCRGRREIVNEEA